MKITIQKDRLEITVENDTEKGILEYAFIENVLDLKKHGDHIDLVRIDRTTPHREFGMLLTRVNHNKEESGV